jgi:uncharacterized membrane protein YeiH
MKQVAVHVSLITVIEIVAILVGAFSGFIEARRKRMDLVGVFTVAFITAFGGGTLRDILLDRRPLFWVTHQEYAILIFVLALIAVAADPHAAPDGVRTPDRHRRRHRPRPVLDGRRVARRKTPTCRCSSPR